jgi:glycosyltransferase involved in cell wall biosynthesis
MNGYKIVYDIVEDNRFVTSYSGFMNKLRVNSSRYLLKVTPFIADSIIVISRHLEDRMKEICRNKIPVTFVPITVNFKFFDKEYKAPGKQMKIFYGGSFGEKDGLKYLLKGFELVAKYNGNVILVLTGKGEVKYDFQDIMKVINNSSYKDQIHYKGYLTTDEYYKVLNECDIFCMTRNNSFYANAGFPFKLGEFLASGKAVIATDVGDVSKYLKNGVNSIIIKPESAEDIAKAINDVIKNPEWTRQLGMEARKTAEQYFNSSLLSHRLNKIFSEV